MHLLLRLRVAKPAFACRCAIPIFFILLPIASFLLSRAVHFIARGKRPFLERIGESIIPVLSISLSAISFTACLAGDAHDMGCESGYAADKCNIARGFTI